MLNKLWLPAFYSSGSEVMFQNNPYIKRFKPWTKPTNDKSKVQDCVDNHVKNEGPVRERNPGHKSWGKRT